MQNDSSKLTAVIEKVKEIIQKNDKMLIFT
jgi:hypothetical protein